MDGRAYHNENDPYAAEWLRRLIAGGHIAPGDVDERDIRDVRASDLAGYVQCHFFAGIGGWSYALRLAGWPDNRPVWTGSCPCQPFSLAGARQGFDDSRHLWPEFARLIGDAKPPTVLGEQVASATDWLGVVRGDLDAMGYAVGAIPIEAASAGADHLRDRFWFVADMQGNASGTGFRNRQPPGNGLAVIGDGSGRDMEHTSRERRGEGGAEPIFRSGRTTASGNGGVGLADAHDARSQGRSTERERASERIAGPHGLANSNIAGPSDGELQRSGQQRGLGEDTGACTGSGLAYSNRQSERGRPAEESRTQICRQGEMEGRHRERDGLLNIGTRDGYEWVIGADGKSRRVKSGIRLLVNGFPARVGLLRGFGNAIDPRPASEFIRAFLETESIAA